MSKEMILDDLYLSFIGLEEIEEWRGHIRVANDNISLVDGDWVFTFEMDSPLRMGKGLGRILMAIEYNFLDEDYTQLRNAIKRYYNSLKGDEKKEFEIGMMYVIFGDNRYFLYGISDVIEEMKYKIGRFIDLKYSDLEGMTKKKVCKKMINHFIDGNEKYELYAQMLLEAIE